MQVAPPSPIPLTSPTHVTNQVGYYERFGYYAIPIENFYFSERHSPPTFHEPSVNLREPSTKFLLIGAPLAQPSMSLP